jgi:aminoglycoside 6-adenylyltransferase
VIVYATEPAALLHDRSWTGEIGRVLVQMPPKGRERAWRLPTRLVLYEDGTKIDFTIQSLTALREARLPRELDNGYRVLADKDRAAAELPPASGTAYVLRRPDQDEFTAVVEEFWWETTYVVKNLSRGELLPAKFSFDCVLRLDLLRRMLEWRAALDRGWAYSPGVMGRGLKGLEDTFAGADIGDNRRALWRTIEMFRAAATTVARQLALEYPHELDAKMTRYLESLITSA